MITELYHTRPLCHFSPAYDLGPELLRHSIPDSKVLLSLGRCRRSIFPRISQRVVPGPDLYCGPHCLKRCSAQSPSCCLYSWLRLSATRTTCSAHLHMASRTRTWPPAHGRAPCITAAAYNVSTRIHQAHTTHPEKQAYHLNNYSTSTDLCFKQVNCLCTTEKVQSEC